MGRERKLQNLAATLGMVFMGLVSACSNSQPNQYQGYVEGEFVYCSSTQAGKLDQLNVTRGELVQKGKTLFVLEREYEEAAVRQADEQLKASEAALENIRTGKRPPELDVIRGQLQQAIAAAQLSQIQWIRDQAQFEIGAIAESQLDISRSNFERDQGKEFEIRSQLASQELPGRDFELLGQTAEVKVAKATLEQARWKLNQKIVDSPKAAFVFDTLFREGEYVSSGQPVVSLLPPENIKVKFFVPETALGKIKIGDKVSILREGERPSMAAQVTYISPQAEFTPPVIYSNETRSKLIYLIEAHTALEDASRLHPGQPVEVSLNE